MVLPHTTSFFSKCIKNRLVALIVLYSVVTVIMFYPLSIKISSHIHDNYDSLFLLWTFSWYKNIIYKDPLNVLNSNILYPDNLTLAYSNLLISKVPIFLLFDIITKNALTAYNLTIASSFVIAAVAFFYLAYYLTKNTIVSIIGGIVYSFSPIKIGRLSLAQVLNLEFFPLAVLFCEKYFARKQVRYLVAFLFFSAIQLLSEGYIAMIFSITFSLYLILRFKTKLLDKKFIAGGIVTLAIVSIFYLPYIYLIKDRPIIFKKELVRTIELSLHPDSLWMLSSEMGKNVTSRLLPFVDRGRPDSSAYFGVLPLILLLIYIFKVKHTTKIIWMFVLIVSFSLAYGPYYILSNGQPIKLPYYYLWKLFPPLSQIRSPGRFSLATVLPISVSSVMALDYLFRKFNKSIAQKTMLLVSILILLIVDNLFIPFPNEKLISIPKVYYRLTQLPRGAIFEFPFHTNKDFLIDKYNYFSTANFYPIVMAYSSNYSGTFHYFKYLELNNLLFTSAVPEKLKEIKVKYILVHEDKISKWETLNFTKLIEEFGYQLIEKVDSTYIYHYMSF